MRWSREGRRENYLFARRGEKKMLTMDPSRISVIKEIRGGRTKKKKIKKGGSQKQKGKGGETTEKKKHCPP